MAEAIQASGAEVRELMERWGLEGGAGSVVLPPDDVVLEQQLASQAGATCQVWKGKLRGQVRSLLATTVGVTTSLRGKMFEQIDQHSKCSQKS